MKFKKLFYFVYLALCAQISSCSVTPLDILTQKMYVTLDSKFNANASSAVIVDFVFIYDKDVLGQVKGLTAAQWFSKKQQIVSDLEMNNKIQVYSKEVVPGNRDYIKGFKPMRRPTEVIIFSNYLSDGDHRVAVDNYCNLLVSLGENDFTVKKNFENL